MVNVDHVEGEPGRPSPLPAAGKSMPAEQSPAAPDGAWAVRLRDSAASRPPAHRPVRIASLTGYLSPVGVRPGGCSGSTFRPRRPTRSRLVGWAAAPCCFPSRTTQPTVPRSPGWRARLRRPRTGMTCTPARMVWPTSCCRAARRRPQPGSACGACRPRLRRLAGRRSSATSTTRTTAGGRSASTATGTQAATWAMAGTMTG